jgi:hypothetical protein
VRRNYPTAPSGLHVGASAHDAPVEHNVRRLAIGAWLGGMAVGRRRRGDHGVQGTTRSLSLAQPLLAASLTRVTQRETSRGSR